MNTLTAIGLAQLSSLIVLVLWAFWYAVPWLKARSLADALIPLLWVHAFRSVALQLYSAQQAGFPIPDAVRDHNVFGDLAGMVLALLAIAALRYRVRYAPMLVWLLVVETVVDIGTGMPAAARGHALGFASGATWLVLVYYVPLVLVSLVLMVWQLVSRRSETVATTSSSVGYIETRVPQ
jgi:hypothetical protein